MGDIYHSISSAEKLMFLGFGLKSFIITVTFHMYCLFYIYIFLRISFIKHPDLIMLAKMTPAERKSVRLKIQKASLLFMFKFVIAKVLASFCYLICGFSRGLFAAAVFPT